MSHHMIQITSSAMVYTSTRGENKNELVVKTGSLLVFIRVKKKKKNQVLYNTCSCIEKKEGEATFAVIH